MTDLERKLSSIGACADAIEWVGSRTATEAWEQCERADWMIWAIARINGQRDAVRAACICARRALRFVPDGELRPLRAIEAAESWAANPTEENRKSAAEAAEAAEAAAKAAAWAAAAEAAWAAKAEHRTMCAEIRSAFPCPWSEQ